MHDLLFKFKDQTSVIGALDMQGATTYKKTGKRNMTESKGHFYLIESGGPYQSHMFKVIRNKTNMGEYVVDKKLIRSLIIEVSINTFQKIQIL